MKRSRKIKINAEINRTNELATMDSQARELLRKCVQLFDDRLPDVPLKNEIIGYLSLDSKFKKIFGGEYIKTLTTPHR
jgi:hypothetical protein